MLLSPRTCLALATTFTSLFLVGCGDDGQPTGHDSPEEVIAAHVEAGRTYDLVGGCRLRPPEQLEVYAAADDVDVDGYCEFATADVVAMADDATRDRSEAIYTDPDVEELSRTDGTWFRIAATDGSYEEEVKVVEHGGRWYVGDVEAHVHDDDGGDGHHHDHDLEGAPDEDHSQDPNSPEGDEPQSGAEDQSG